MATNVNDTFEEPTRFIHSANADYYGIGLKHLAIARNAAVICNMGENFLSELDHLAATMKYHQSEDEKSRGAK